MIIQTNAKIRRYTRKPC